MPSWNEILTEVQLPPTIYDDVRRKYLQKVFKTTGRNVIIYYDAFLQKPDMPSTGLNELDKNGFMAAIHQLDRNLGLDLILHTPGGDFAATEALVFYLRQMFDNNIRAIVPQIAMSAGTMIALACKEIVMGKHSSLGPIDPQIGGISAHSIVEEFNRAYEEMKADQTKAYVWQPIIQKYPPALIGEAEKAIRWSEDTVSSWLGECMFHEIEDAAAKIERIIRELGDHALTMSHARRISIERAQSLDLQITVLESNQALQESIMSLHHACMITLERTLAYKMIENQNGIAYIKLAKNAIPSA